MQKKKKKEKEKWMALLTHSALDGQHYRTPGPRRLDEKFGKTAYNKEPVPLTIAKMEDQYSKEANVFVDGFFLPYHWR